MTKMYKKTYACSEFRLYQSITLFQNIKLTP